jgi:selenocysteine lyase/cysteine desulfurase
MTTGQYRELFEIPDGVAYFNTAYNAPLLRSSRVALESASSAKSRPWERSSEDFFADAEAIRHLSSSMFGGCPDDYALVPAASYGISTAARILEKELRAGDTIVLMEGEFPSNVYPWRRAAIERGATIKTVHTPLEGDWTSAILSVLDPSTKVAALSGYHWMTGAPVDLTLVSKRCSELGTALVLDMTQSLGAVPFNVDEIKPDFMIAAGYKWLLCPYGFGLMYVAPGWHDRRPLEETWLARANAEDFTRLSNYSDAYRPGARRYDVGETCVTTVLPGALAALRQIQLWGAERILREVGHVNRTIHDKLGALGFNLLSTKQSEHKHILSLPLPPQWPVTATNELSAQKIFVSLRGDSIRIAPHLHNSADDIDALVAGFAKVGW